MHPLRSCAWPSSSLLRRISFCVGVDRSCCCPAIYIYFIHILLNCCCAAASLSATSGLPWAPPTFILITSWLDPCKAAASPSSFSGERFSNAIYAMNCTNARENHTSILYRRRYILYVYIYVHPFYILLFFWRLLVLSAWLDIIICTHTYFFVFFFNIIF